MSEVNLAKRLWEIEQKRKSLEHDVGVLKDEYAAASAELTELLMESGKSSTGHIEGVGEFSIVRKTFPSVNKDSMPRFVEYLRSIGDGGIVRETVDAQTLGAYLRDKIETLTDMFVAFPERRAEYVLSLAPAGTEHTISDRELAIEYLKQVGVSVFSECKLSHTKKGK